MARLHLPHAEDVAMYPLPHDVHRNIGAFVGVGAQPAILAPLPPATLQHEIRERSMVTSVHGYIVRSIDTTRLANDDIDVSYFMKFRNTYGVEMADNVETFSRRALVVMTFYPW